MENIFVDTDIIVDLLAKKVPFHIHAENLFSYADKNEIKISVSSLSFANLHYLLSRQFSAAQSRKWLLKFKTLVSVLAVTEKVIDLALSSDFADFEDGIQYYTAIENNIQTLLTRNLKDFKHAKITVLTAEQFLTDKK